MSGELVEVGKVVNTHGVRGEVKVLPWADNPKFFDGIRYVILPDGGRREIERSRVIKNCALLKLSGVDDMDSAKELKGKVLYIDKADLPRLPEGTYYVRDIIGLKAVTAAGRVIGVVKDVLQTGANDVYTVKKPDGSDIYIPAIKQCVKQINISEGYVLVELLEGLE